MAYLRDPSGFVFTSDVPEIHKDCEKLTNAAGKIARANYCKDELRALLKPGDTVNCILRHVSRSGMQRRISFCVTAADGDVRNLDNLIADALGYRHHEQSGLVIRGCGMDMGFHTVYNLGATLWPDGTPEPHGTRNGVPDSDGGYALKSCWL